MDMLAGYSDDADSNTPNVDRFQQMTAKMDGSVVKDGACNLEAEWESFEKMIGGQQDTKPCAVPPVGVAPPSLTSALGEAPMDLDSAEEESMPILTKITSPTRKTRHSSSLSSSSGSRASSVESDKSSERTGRSAVPRAYAYETEEKNDDENPLKDGSGSQSRSASPTQRRTARSCSRSRSPSPVGRSKSRSKSPLAGEKSRSKSQSPATKARRSSEGKHSRSKSRERRRHGSGKRHRRSRSRSHDRKRHSSRERRKHKDRHRRRSHSRDRKSSRSKGHRRSRSRDRKRSRSKSRERRSGSGRHKERKRSQSRDQKRSRSKDRRRSRSRERRYKSRRYSHSRSRSRSYERESPRVTRAHVPAKNKPVNFKEKMRQQLFNASKLLAEQGASTSGEGDDKDSQKDKISKLDASAIYKNMSGVTPQMALLQTMAAMHQKAQEITGVAVPKYYNPAAVNPLKYAEQVQKRKLLWSKNKEKKPETETSSQWQATAFISDNDGKTAAKFRKLMGMKDGEDQVDEDKAKELEEIKKKQEELFYHLDKEYEFARMTTHTQRGVGLGFGSQILPHQ